MKLIAAALLLTTFSSFAGVDCTKNVEKTFRKSQPKMTLNSIVLNGKLAPGEDRPYMQQEIWNDTKSSLDIYHVEASFMARFAYVALVNPQNCEVKNLIEVLFE